MEGISDIIAEDFEEAVTNSDMSIVLEFWVRSCSYCQMFKPVYDRLPGHYGDGVRFLRMNMLKSIGSLRLAEGMGVEQMPTTKVFCGGAEVGEIVGFRKFEEAVEEFDGILSSEGCVR